MKTNSNNRSIILGITIVLFIVGVLAGYYIGVETKTTVTSTVTKTQPSVTETKTITTTASGTTVIKTFTQTTIITSTVTLTTATTVQPTGSPFTLKVIPESLRGNLGPFGPAIAGEKIVFLVTIANEGSSQDKEVVKISASANGSAVSAEPGEVSVGQVAELTVIPDVTAIGKNITLIVNAESGGLKRSKTLIFTVAEGEDTLGDYARQMRDMFIPWLEANHPELGITNQTQWAGTIISPIWLVVSHYLFFSKEWEMHVYWHVMIPPYDWVRIDLRHRFTEVTPSLAFEISSRNASLPVQAIAPPDSIWR